MPDHPPLHVLPETHCYRALLLDLRGTVLRVRDIFACDDVEAYGIARSMMDGRVIELWDRRRFIGRFGPAQD